MGSPVTIGGEGGMLKSTTLWWAVKNLLFSSHTPLSIMHGVRFKF